MEKLNKVEKLKLVRSPLEVLEIELPEGEILKLEIKNATVTESDKMQRDLIALDLKLNSIPAKITSTNYSISILKIICNDFDVSLLDDIEVNHLTEIAESINELSDKARERKKKAKLSSSIKS